MKHAGLMVLGLLCLAIGLCSCSPISGSDALSAEPGITAESLTGTPASAYEQRMATLKSEQTLKAASTSTPTLTPTPTPLPLDLPVGLGTPLPPLQVIDGSNASSLEPVGRYYETWQVNAGLSENGNRLYFHSFYGFQAFEFPTLDPLPLIPVGITTMPGGAPADQRHLLGISADGSLLAVADRAGHPTMVQVWSLETGEKLCDLNMTEAQSHYHAGALRLEFTPDNTHFSLVGRWSEEGAPQARLWAVAGCREVVKESLENGVLLPVFSPDGSRYARMVQGKIHLTKVDGSDPVVVEPIAQVFGLGWTPDGSRVIAVYGDKTLLYDTASGEPLQEIAAANGYQNALVRVSSDGRWISLLGEKTWFLNTEDGTAVRELSPEQAAEFPVSGTILTPDEDEWLASQGEDILGGFRTSQGLTALWDQYGKVALIEESSGIQKAEAALPFVGIQINQEGNAFSGWEGGLAYDLDALIHRSAARRGQFLISHTGQYAVRNQRVNNQLMVEFYRTDDGTLNASPEFFIASVGPSYDYYEFRYSADDRLVAGFAKNQSGGATSNNLILWESATGMELGRLIDPFLQNATLFDFDFSPDGALLLVSTKKSDSGYVLTLVDTASMTLLRQHEIVDCRMSAPFAMTNDSQYVVTLTPGCRVGVYDVATWNLSMENNPFYTTYAGPSEINFGLSADDTLLAIGYQKTLEVWSMESGSKLFSVENLNNDIFAFIGSFNLIFSPDNTLLIARYGQWIHAWSTVELYGIPK